MSRRSENVKRWRRATKDRIVKSMGGKCCVCGYNKCNSALALHHIDPSQKDFSFGAIRANIKSWMAIVAELKKCALVCNNCHSEIHDGVTFLPEDHATFNSEYEQYKELRAEKIKKEKLKFKCPVCNKVRLKENKTCSVECNLKLRAKRLWDSVNLEEEIKTKSVVAIAKELGCSDVAVHKRLKKLKLK